MSLVAEDFTDAKFGRLTGIRRVANVGHGLRWLWQCECGKQVVTCPSKVKSGHTQSCGCLWPEKCRKHGHGHDKNGQQTRTYKAWVNMRTRTCGRYSQYDKHYSSMGVIVCERWKSNFQAFLSDMGECPEGMTLDRHPDNNGNYEPTNCRWATPAQQNRNMRNNKNVSFRGQEMCLTDACILAGLHRATVQSRLNTGMSIEEALTKPKRR